MSLNDPYFRLQAARRAHRAAAHKYARTKNTLLNKPNYDAAVDSLEKAALAFALCAAEYGMRADCANPSFWGMTDKERKAYENAVDPEPTKDKT
jgi:hypothetical protein